MSPQRRHAGAVPGGAGAPRGAHGRHDGLHARLRHQRRQPRYCTPIIFIWQTLVVLTLLLVVDLYSYIQYFIYIVVNVVIQMNASFVIAYSLIYH